MRDYTRLVGVLVRILNSRASKVREDCLETAEANIISKILSLSAEFSPRR